MDRFGVLFVDDDENILNGIRRVLYGRREWDLLFAANGMDAIDMMLTNDVRIVVTDIAMPAMNGEQLIRRMHDENPEIVVIVLSGHWTEDISLRQLGPYIQFLSKPVSPPVLLDALETATQYARLVAA